jgi:hypothetical protein
LVWTTNHVVCNFIYLCRMPHLCHAHATPVLLHFYTRAMHMPHIPPSLYMGVLRRTRRRAPYRWVSRLTLDPSRFRSGVSGRKPLRRVSAQILTFTRPGSQNVYERVDTPLAALFTLSCSLTTMSLHVATLSDCILPSLYLSAPASIRPITSHVSATLSMCSAQLSI